MRVVVDTNVPKVANGRKESPQASARCVNTCIGRIRGIMRGDEKLVLDDKWILIREYRNNLRASGEPGAGDRFLKWILQNKDRKCDVVSITPIGGSDVEFAEFPVDPALAKFDDDDRKFVVVALSHPHKPPILQAVDSKWVGFHAALQQHGVRVEELCPQDVQRFRGPE